MFLFIFGLLVGVLGIFVASMRSGVKFHVDLSFQNVKRTILDPFREKTFRMCRHQNMQMQSTETTKTTETTETTETTQTTETTKTA